MSATFLGYPRKNGSIGVRNWVGVISIMDNCNPVTRAICNAVDGTVPITTLFVRGQYGRDLEITYNTLAGMGANPNIASVQTNVDDKAPTKADNVYFLPVTPEYIVSVP